MPPSSSHLRLKYRRHSRKFVARSTEDNTDMLIIIKGVPLPCHKAVVGRYSKTIGRAVKAQKSGVEFIIADEKATAEGVFHFLRSMYTDWDVYMDPYVDQIYRLSHVYDSVIVRENAVAAFHRMMSECNFWEIACMNDGEICELLLAVCVDFAVTRWPQLTHFLPLAMNSVESFACLRVEMGVCKILEIEEGRRNTI